MKVNEELAALLHSFTMRHLRRMGLDKDVAPYAQLSEDEKKVWCSYANELVRFYVGGDELDETE